jgi:hypothetical protein
MEAPVKKLRWLSVADDFDGVAGRGVYSNDGVYIGRLVGESRAYWLLDSGGKIHKLGSSRFCIEI